MFDTGTSECPVSVLEMDVLNNTHTPAMEMAQYFFKTQAMYKSFGASPYGGNLNKWPSRMVDSFVILQQEHIRVENMMIPRNPSRR